MEVTVKELKKTVDKHTHINIYIDEVGVILPLGSLDDDLIVEYNSSPYGYGVAKLSDENTFKDIKNILRKSLIVSHETYDKRSMYANEIEKAIEKNPTMDIKSFKYMMDRLR